MSILLSKRVQWWEKDGAWHITEPYSPTTADRKRYPASYPPARTGPFYRWRPECYKTELEAIQALRKLEG